MLADFLGSESRKSAKICGEVWFPYSIGDFGIMWANRRRARRFRLLRKFWPNLWARHRENPQNPAERVQIAHRLWRFCLTVLGRLGAVKQEPKASILFFTFLDEI